MFILVQTSDLNKAMAKPADKKTMMRGEEAGSGQILKETTNVVEDKSNYESEGSNQESIEHPLVYDQDTTESPIHKVSPKLKRYPVRRRKLQSQTPITERRRKLPRCL